MAGLLRVDGTVELSQFWPEGESDADTTKIVVHVGPGAFKFRPEGKSSFRTTRVFDDAFVIGKGRSPAVKTSKKTGERTITVRLQGVDAPELHYRPVMPDTPKPTKAQRSDFNEHNDELRQPEGETCTVALHARLAKGETAVLKCVVESRVDEPNEVCDMYGRFIGDLKVALGASTLVVNRWLLRNGWALPAFYNSMSADEIATLMADAAKGRTKGRIWQQYSSRIGTLNEGLRFRKGGPVDPGGDTGNVIMPKVYRRLANWSIAKKHTSQQLPSFKEFISTGSGNEFHLRDDYLSQGAVAAVVHHLGDDVIGGKLALEPEDIVFREQPSNLVDSNGTPVTNW